MVYPLNNLYVEDTNGLENGINGFCNEGSLEYELNIPENDRVNGVQDSDLHIYVTHITETEENFLAYAFPC